MAKTEKNSKDRRDKILKYLEGPLRKNEPSKSDEKRVKGYIEEIKKSEPSYLDNIQASIEKKEGGSRTIRHTSVLNWIKKAKGEPFDYKQDQSEKRNVVESATLPVEVSQIQTETGTIKTVDAKPVTVKSEVHRELEHLELRKKLFHLCHGLRMNPEDSTLQSNFIEACNKHTEMVKQDFFLNLDMCSIAICLLTIELPKENEQKLLPCFRMFGWLDKLLLDYREVFPQLSVSAQKSTLRMMLKDNPEKSLKVILPLYDDSPKHHDIICEIVLSSLGEEAILSKLQTVEDKQIRRNVFLASLLRRISDRPTREKCLKAQTDFLHRALEERQSLDSKIKSLEKSLGSKSDEIEKKREELLERDRNIRNLMDEQDKVSNDLQVEMERTRQLRSEIEKLQMTILHTERKADEASGIVKRNVYDKLSKILEFATDISLLGFNSDQINWTETTIIEPIRRLHTEYGEELGLI